MRRRDFLATGAAAAATTLSTPRRAGAANDRLGLAMVGCGGRGGYLLGEAFAADPDGIEVVALCDVWTPARERMAARVREKTGRSPQLFARYADVLARDEVDAVVVATPDFAHSPILEAAVRAGKDVFVEKPLTARLEDAVSAYDAVKATGRVVQVGTQRRSDVRFQTGAKRVREGALGRVCHVEAAWHRNVPSWARPLDDVRSEDVDWEQYQMGLEPRPFDASRFRRWHLYYEYTTGLVGLLGSHVIDVAQWYMDDPHPVSAVALGGIFSWPDGRETSDTFESLFEFPKGWMLSFASRLGSGPETDYAIFHGERAWLDTRDWRMRPAANRPAEDADDEPIEMPPPGPSHVGEWLSCVRSRKTPSASIEAGYAHAVACCLAREAERTGRRMRYDSAHRRIVEA